jgi:hypothetical protein
MSEIFRVFGTQFDPSVVQGLLRQERKRKDSERNRSRAAARVRRKTAAKQSRRSSRPFEQN